MNDRNDATAVFMAEGEGRVLHTMVDRLLKASGAVTAGRLSATVVPSREGYGPPLHRHLRNDEAFFVLEGRYEFRIGDSSYAAGAGAFAYVPMGTAHAFRGLADSGRLLEMFVPADFEGYFEELERLMAAHRDTEDAVSALQAKYGMEVLGPPIGSSDA